MMRTSWLLVLLFVLSPSAGCGPGSAGRSPPSGGVDHDGREELEADRAELHTTAQRETFENPEYASWAKFKVGTTVVLRSVTETAGIAGKTVTTTRHTLTELTGEYAVVEAQSSTTRYDGVTTDNPPDAVKYARRIPLPPGVAKEDFGKPPRGAEQGEENIIAAGVTHHAKWQTGKDRNEAGEVFTKVWSADGVPGRLVKSVTRTPAIGKTTTVEATEVIIR
jgi:hypothetical protein